MRLLILVLPEGKYTKSGVVWLQVYSHKPHKQGNKVMRHETARCWWCRCAWYLWASLRDLLSHLDTEQEGSCLWRDQLRARDRSCDGSLPDKNLFWAQSCLLVSCFKSFVIQLSLENTDNDQIGLIAYGWESGKTHQCTEKVLGCGWVLFYFPPIWYKYNKITGQTKFPS